MIYFLQRPDGSIRIGTTKELKQRLIVHKSKYGQFEVIGVMDGDRQYEQGLHKRFAHLNTGKDGKEWFYPSGELSEFIALNTKPFVLPIKPKKQRCTKAIVVPKSTHKLFRDFAIGLGTTMNDAILFLLCDHMNPGDDPLLVGRAERNARKQADTPAL